MYIYFVLEYFHWVHVRWAGRCFYFYFVGKDIIYSRCCWCPNGSYHFSAGLPRSGCWGLHLLLRMRPRPPTHRGQKCQGAPATPQQWLPLCTVIPLQWALYYFPQFLHRIKLQLNSRGSRLNNVPLTVYCLFLSLLLCSTLFLIPMVCR